MSVCGCGVFSSVLVVSSFFCTPSRLLHPHPYLPSTHLAFPPTLSPSPPQVTQYVTQGLVLSNINEPLPPPPPSVACQPVSDSDPATAVLHLVRMAAWSLPQCEEWLTAVAGRYWSGGVEWETGGWVVH